MGMMRKLAGFGVLLFVSLVPLSAAQAQQCSPPYSCTSQTPEVGTSDSGAVLPSEAEQSPAAVVAPAVAEEEPAAVVTQTPAPAAVESAPTGSLPFTGGDVVGITVIGAAALGLGTIMVRRSKAAQATA